MSTTPAPTNPDTTLGTAFWREHPHLFLAAGWGEEYCRCCLDPDGGEIHDVVTDPSVHPGNCTDYRVPRKPDEILFSVTGWNDGDEEHDGAACHYQTQDSYQAALDYATLLSEHGDDRGRIYQHYSISERIYFTAVDTNVVVLS